MTSAGTPKCTDNHVVIIERVVEMTVDFANVDAAKARDASQGIRRPNSRQERQDPERLFELSDEYLRVGSILEPPFLFASDVSSRGSRESNAARVNASGVPLEYLPHQKVDQRPCRRSIREGPREALHDQHHRANRQDPVAGALVRYLRASPLARRRAAGRREPVP